MANFIAALVDSTVAETPRSASQRIIIALVQAMDFIAVEALVSDLHPRAERTDCRKIFHRETDGLRCCGKATIAELLPWTALTLGDEQFGR
jgi:hypothetical protein